MTAVVTVVFTSCPTRGGQQRNQFTLYYHVTIASGVSVEFTTFNFITLGFNRDEDTKDT